MENKRGRAVWLHHDVFISNSHPEGLLFRLVVVIHKRLFDISIGNFRQAIEISGAQIFKVGFLERWALS